MSFILSYSLDLHNVIQKSFTPKVQVSHICGPEIYNIKVWLSPYTKEIGNHSKPHHFSFCKVDGKTQMYYRKWSCDPWRPNDVEYPDPDVPEAVGTNDGLTLLKVKRTTLTNKQHYDTDFIEPSFTVCCVNCLVYSSF